MTDKEFEERLREVCSGISESPDPCVWEGIEAKMSARRRLVLWRRAGTAVAAAAAVIVLFMAWPSDSHNSADEVSKETPSMQLAEIVETDAVNPDVSVRSSREGRLAVSDADLHSQKQKNTDTGQVSPAVSESDSLETMPSPIAEPPMSDENVHPRIISEGYDVSDYQAFQEEVETVDRRLSISASTDFYTVYGSGNVNFSTKSMSAGGVSAAGAPAVKPLSGETPHHDLPLTAGVSVQYGFGAENSYGKHRFGVGMGVNYTFMRSQYEALVTKDFLYKYGEGREQVEVKQYINYVGIPLFFNVNIITTDKLFFYASVGGEVEKGLQLKYRFTDSKGVTSLQTLPVSGLQWSASAGLGFEYRFLNFMGVYADPSLTYFFDCSQPYCIREEQRLQLTIGLGLRFHF